MTFPPNLAAVSGRSVDTAAYNIVTHPLQSSLPVTSLCSLLKEIYSASTVTRHSTLSHTKRCFIGAANPPDDFPSLTYLSSFRLSQRFRRRYLSCEGGKILGNSCGIVKNSLRHPLPVPPSRRPRLGRHVFLPRLGREVEVGHCCRSRSRVGSSHKRSGSL